MIGAKEHAGMEMTSEDDDDEPGSSSVIAADVDNGAEERRLFNEKNKRSVRRKTHSPKRVQKGPPQEMPILDERYAASLLEYYSKHKPYYPVSETEFNKQECTTQCSHKYIDNNMEVLIPKHPFESCEFGAYISHVEQKSTTQTPTNFR